MDISDFNLSQGPHEDYETILKGSNARKIILLCLQDRVSRRQRGHSRVRSWIVQTSHTLRFGTHRLELKNIRTKREWFVVVFLVLFDARSSTTWIAIGWSSPAWRASRLNCVNAKDNGSFCPDLLPWRSILSFSGQSSKRTAAYCCCTFTLLHIWLVGEGFYSVLIPPPKSMIPPYFEGNIVIS